MEGKEKASGERRHSAQALGNGGLGVSIKKTLGAPQIITDEGNVVGNPGCRPGNGAR